MIATPLPPCPPGLICAQQPPHFIPGPAAPKCPQATRAYPFVQCIRPDGRVIVRVWRRHRP